MNDNGKIEDLLRGLPIKSRPQHYTFAHRLLPSYARQHPERVFVLLASEETSQTFLRNLWDAAGHDLPASEKVESQGLCCITQKRENHVIAVVQLPTPIVITEAHFVALAFGPVSEITADNLHEIPFRYFTLEFGVSFTTEPQTILCEWTKDGSHLNFGAGPKAENEAFVSAVCSNMAPSQ